MPNSTTDSVSFPLPTNDSRPLPEIIAEHYNFPLAYHDIDDGRFYAVQDWIKGVSQTEVPRRFWNDLKKRIKKANVQLSDSFVQLPYRSSNNKTYKMDHAPAEMLYIITQRMDTNTGLRNQILEFLAKSGVVIDDFRIDPEKAIDAAIEAYRRMGKSEKWIATRIQSKVMRLRFTSAFRGALRTEPSGHQYAQITDEMRLGLWKRKTQTLKDQLGMVKGNLRDHMSGLALSYEQLAENISAVELETRENLEFEQSRGIVRRNSEHVGKHAEETSKMLGIDIATNKPLLPDKTDQQ